MQKKIYPNPSFKQAFKLETGRDAEKKRKLLSDEIYYFLGVLLVIDELQLAEKNSLMGWPSCDCLMPVRMRDSKVLIIHPRPWLRYSMSV